MLVLVVVFLVTALLLGLQWLQPGPSGSAVLLPVSFPHLLEVL